MATGPSRRSCPASVAFPSERCRLLPAPRVSYLVGNSTIWVYSSHCLLLNCLDLIQNASAASCRPIRIRTACHVGQGELHERTDSRNAARHRPGRAEGICLARLAAVVRRRLRLLPFRNSPGLPPRPAAAADDAKEKPVAAPTPHAVETSSAFIDALDAKQREKAL